MIADLVPAEQIIDIGRQAHMQVFQKRITLRVERWNKLTNLLFYHLEPCHLGTNLLCSSAWQRNGTAPAFSGGKMGSPCRCLPCLRLSPEHFFLNTCPLFHLNTWPSITWSPDRSITCAPFSQSPAIISPEEPPAPFLSWPNINFYALPCSSENNMPLPDSLVVIYLLFDTMPNFPHKLFSGKLSVALVP